MNARKLRLSADDRHFAQRAHYCRQVTSNPAYTNCNAIEATTRYARRHREMSDGGPRQPHAGRPGVGLDARVAAFSTPKHGAMPILACQAAYADGKGPTMAQSTRAHVERLRTSRRKRAQSSAIKARARDDAGREIEGRPCASPPCRQFCARFERACFSLYARDTLCVNKAPYLCQRERGVKRRQRARARRAYSDGAAGRRD